MMKPQLWGLGFVKPIARRFPEAPDCDTSRVLAIDLPLLPHEAVKGAAVGSHTVFVVSTQGRVLAVDLAGSSVQEIGGLGIAEHVVSGGEHALAVNSEGAVFSWGSAVAGRLGIGDRVAGLLRKGHVPYTCTPERVQALWNKRIVGLSCGEMHCLALSIDSEVFAWGSASMGRLGVGSDALMLPCAEAKEPLLVRALQGRNVVQVTCSKVNSGALSSSGEIFTWGATCYGLTTDRGSSAAQLEPALLPCAPTDGHRIVSMAMGKLHALALSISGRVFSWGWAGDGALGLGPPTDGGSLCRAVSQPTELVALVEHPVRQVACGEGCSFAVGRDGRLLVWGCVGVAPNAIYPVWGRSSDGDGAHEGCIGGQHADHLVLWPSCIRQQPPGHLTLPATGYCSSALFMMTAWPDKETTHARHGQLQEQENSSANLLRPLVFPEAPGACCGHKRRNAEEAEDLGGFMWDRRLRAAPST